MCDIVCVLVFGGVSMSDGMCAGSAQSVSCVGVYVYGVFMFVCVGVLSVCWADLCWAGVCGVKAGDVADSVGELLLLACVCIVGVAGNVVGLLLFVCVEFAAAISARAERKKALRPGEFWVVWITLLAGGSSLFGLCLGMKSASLQL